MLAILKKYVPTLTTVRDATKSVDIDVTARDESTSKRKNHHECAMAIACKRSFHADAVIISKSRAYLIKGNIATRYDLPVSVQKEIVSFDRGASFEPRSYELMKPNHELGTAAGSSQRRSSPAKVAKPKHITEKIRVALNKKES